MAPPRPGSPPAVEQDAGTAPCCGAAASSQGHPASTSPGAPRWLPAKISLAACWWHHATTLVATPCLLVAPRWQASSTSSVASRRHLLHHHHPHQCLLVAAGGRPGPAGAGRTHLHEDEDDEGDEDVGAGMAPGLQDADVLELIAGLPLGPRLVVEQRHQRVLLGELGRCRGEPGVLLVAHRASSLPPAPLWLPVRP